MPVFTGNRYFIRRMQNLPRPVTRKVADILYRLTCSNEYHLLEMLDMVDEITVITEARLPIALENLVNTIERIHDVRIARYIKARISYETYNAPYLYTGDVDSVIELSAELYDL
ncbi:uncharacterized protein LOC130676752 [Microplitis mediator]|uniref:uncharacterized protein LOC130665803 n=1 Tax=Microplitis mediator TaxID=375433 RepID=UPI002552A8D2|nr:uncharacterized protein LOC130665803 [Microplitis mediator]XP_057322382.1 uncharacterized protein LOC130665804 [Microplitis mediator]XP_057339219.1 uncharacterized protein LOC130676752 [Microplitis mediator]